MTPEITYLAYAVVLLIVHVLAQACATDLSKGIGWSLGSRDEDRPRSPLAARLERALRNYLETFPAYAALALALAVTDQGGTLSVVGAQIWLAGRIAYLPLTAAGIPYLRSAAWMASMAGLVLMLLALI